MVEGLNPTEKAPGLEPTVLAESGGVVAIAKPAGLATQAPPALPSAESWLRERLPRGAYVGVPHRLDRSVSGVLLLAVTPRAARKLSRQFERRLIGKTYLALVAGPGVEEIAREGPLEWRDFIVKVADEPRARVAHAGERGCKEAVTHVRVVTRIAAHMLLMALEPATGRMHQLRVQAASRAAPIVGDALYGSDLPFGPDSAPATGPRRLPIALHAWRIKYADPTSGLPVGVEAELPGWWPTEVRAALPS